MKNTHYSNIGCTQNLYNYRVKNPQPHLRFQVLFQVKEAMNFQTSDLTKFLVEYLNQMKQKQGAFHESKRDTELSVKD